MSGDLEMLSMGVRLSYEPNETQKSKKILVCAFLVTVSLDFASNGKSQQSHLLRDLSGPAYRQALP